MTVSGGIPMNTHIDRVGGTMPATPALPSGQDLSYLNGGMPGSNPLTNSSDSMGLPMYNIATGNSDSGVAHSGDLGGAGAM